MRLPAIVSQRNSIEYRSAVPGAAFFTDNKLLLTVNGHEYNITSLEGAEGFYESFLFGDLGGILLLGEVFEMEQPPNLLDGLVARIEKVEGDITYVTPLKICMVHTPEPVYHEMEVSTEFGIMEGADVGKPMLQEGSMWAASIKCDAKILESRMYCIG